MPEIATTTTDAAEKSKEEPTGKWTAATALAYLAQHGATPARRAGMPVLELPRSIGLKGLGVVDYLKKKHGVKQLTIDRTKYLCSLGRVLQFIPPPSHR